MILFIIIYYFTYCLFIVIYFLFITLLIIIILLLFIIYVYNHGKVLLRQPTSWKMIQKKAGTKSRGKRNVILVHFPLSSDFILHFSFFQCFTSSHLRKVFCYSSRLSHLTRLAPQISSNYFL